MLIDINKVIVNERIRKDFGNIEELANDIKENGLINPPVVTPEFELIAGERRLRALKHLNYNQIEVRVMTVQDALHQLKLEISENENRKDFSFSEKMKWAEQLKEEYSKIAKGNMSEGGKGEKDFTPIGRVSDKIAQDLDLGSGRNYDKAQYIYNNAPEELIQQLDNEQLSINKAYITLKEQLKSEKEKANQLERQLKQEQSKPPRVIEKEVIVDNTDYTAIRKSKQLEDALNNINTEKERLQRRLDLMTERAEIFKNDSEEYRKLQREIEVLTKEKDDIGKAVRTGVELSGLVHNIESFLKKELCPITYSRALLDASDSPTVIKNVQEIVEVVEKWCGDMRSYLPKNQQDIIIDVEEI
ncbi:ParB N-terminal domain-containing protein [uncultured Clostridium sp.]|uniref:ParB N-terminal domain-containing protein n=1 Tax=uncultured Clostridium sp. TaxID=59620 RepID=UPI0032177B7F